MYLLRNLLILAALTTGCSAFSRHFDGASAPLATATGELARGAGALAVNPANPLGWTDAIAGLAGLGAVLWGGQKTYKKVREKMGRKSA